jgi:hypothetical protein
MVFKKKCPKCGAKNPKENIGCANCGHLLAMSYAKKKVSTIQGSTPDRLRKTEEEAEITCPICGTQYLVGQDEEAIICPNLDCRAVPKTSPYDDIVVVKEKATIKTPEGAETVDCYIKGGRIIVDMHDLLTIPLRNILEFDISGPYVSPRKKREDICRGIISPVRIRYFDHSEKKHWIEFRMDMLQAWSMKDCWAKAHCWFERLKADSAKVLGKKPEMKELSIFGKVKAAFRRSVDYHKEEFCRALCELGINAQIGIRDCAAEADIGRGHSNGIIDIPQGPIRWINYKTLGTGIGEDQPEYIQLGVPDPRLRPDAPDIESFKLVGKAGDLRWKGNDAGLRIIDRMSCDISLNQLVIKSGVLPIRINAYGDFRCWTINHNFYRGDFSLTAENWSCYQAIARHLLAEWTVE